MLDDLRRGDNRAFEQLYRDHYRMVDKMIRENNGTSNDAQDIFQETMIALARMVRKPNFEQKAKWSTLIFAIAKNLWRYRLRGHKPQLNVSLKEEYKEHIADESVEAALIEKEYNAKQKLFAKVLRTLKKDCQRLITGFYSEGLSLDTLAIELGITKQSTKVKKSRCLNGFKKAIAATPEYRNLKN